MPDQATILRELMTKRRGGSDSFVEKESGRTPALIAMTGGKGGIGKTTLALNLALALQQRHRVCLWDVTGNGGLDLLCDCPVLPDAGRIVKGSRRIRDASVEGPRGLQLLAGGGPSTLQELSRGDSESDVLILDLPASDDPAIQNLQRNCPVNLLLTTPDPSSVAAAYSLLKSTPNVEWSLLVNRGESREQAATVIERFRETSRLFLQRTIKTSGWIPEDPAVGQSSYDRTPLVIQTCATPAAIAIQSLADRLDSIIECSRPAGRSG